MSPCPPIGLPRKVIASVIAVLFLLTLAAENLPESAVRTHLEPLQTAANAAAIDQGWGVFAPDPTRIDVNTFGLVTLSGGREIRWDPPSANPITGSNSQERWRKWSARVRLDKNEHLWAPTARRIAEAVANDHAGKPQHIKLVREWSTAPLPGDGFDRDYADFVFFELDL